MSKVELRFLSLQTEEGHIKDNQVRLKIKYCGVCGMDVYIYEGEGGSFAVKPPIIIGHEFSGVFNQWKKM